MYISSTCWIPDFISSEDFLYWTWYKILGKYIYFFSHPYMQAKMTWAQPGKYICKIYNEIILYKNKEVLSFPKPRKIQSNISPKFTSWFELFFFFFLLFGWHIIFQSMLIFTDPIFFIYFFIFVKNTLTRKSLIYKKGP